MDTNFNVQKNILSNCVQLRKEKLCRVECEHFNKLNKEFIYVHSVSYGEDMVTPWMSCQKKKATGP